MTTYEKQLLEMIKHDSYLLSILRAVQELNLTDCWVCAGLIRNKVWDKLHNTTTPVTDIDVIYFDPSDLSWEIEKELEKT
ncbi:nucleotidyltransferase family protein [Carnobacterium viridans]|uniref:nucleotidyltransferase family protein n=1 Tax=Carnobacterium viridans TaxID=174587 RepID=UPI00226BB378|nr:nucleotidyltransferase family protein [Carnobacterium viridans]